MQKKALKSIAGKEDSAFQDFFLIMIFLSNFGNYCKDYAVFYVFPLCF